MAESKVTLALYEYDNMKAEIRQLKEDLTASRQLLAEQNKDNYLYIGSSLGKALKLETGIYSKDEVKLKTDSELKEAREIIDMLIEKCHKIQKVSIWGWLKYKLLTKDSF